MRRREESGEAGNHETVKWTKPVSGSGFCASSGLAEMITTGWQTCNDCSNKNKTVLDFMGASKKKPAQE